MQNAETVLGVLRERGRRGLPCEELYRQLFNPQLYLLAYGRIYANKGAMTPGVTGETVDGMSLGEDRAHHRRDAPRALPVQSGPAGLYPEEERERRPLGLPTWSDKLVGEVVRLLLEAYYEPTFSDRSHGFRPGRGCHTALREVANTWTGTAWFIEGTSPTASGSLDHQVMLVDPGGEDPRQPVPAAGAQHAPGRIPGGLDLERHPQRRAARRCRLPDPVQHLPAQAGQLRRNGSDPGIHPRGTSGRQPGLPRGAADSWHEHADAVTVPRPGRCVPADA